jgi:hypothetical protein
MNKELNKIWNETVPVKELINILNNAGIRFVDIIRGNPPSGYFSFVRCYSNAGNYKFSIPYLVDGENERGHILTWDDVEHPFKIMEWEECATYYTKFPKDSNQSLNGGDYYTGWVLKHHPTVGYHAIHNNCLHSDYEDQGWDINSSLFGKTLQDIVEVICQNKEYPVLGDTVI